jgi:hypothetical protein
MNAAAKQPQALGDAIALTGTPFWYDGAVYLDPGSNKACAKIGSHGRITDAARLGPVLDCLRHGTQPLIDATDGWSKVDLDKLPAPLARYRAKLAALATTETLVLAHAKGDKTEDWAVISVRKTADAGVVTAYVAAHHGR